MRLVEELLRRYAHIHPPHGAIKKELVRSITVRTGQHVIPEDIAIEGGVVRVSGTPTLRQKIFLHKENILSDLTNTIRTHGIRDIR